MFDDTIAFVDRQFEFLNRHKGARSFLIRLRTIMSAFFQDHRIVAVLEDLYREALSKRDSLQEQSEMQRAASVKEKSPDLTEELEALGERVEALQDRHEETFKEIGLEGSTLAGLSLMRIEEALCNFKPEFRISDNAAAAIVGCNTSIPEAFFSDRASGDDLRVMEDSVGVLKEEAEKLHEGIRRRLGQMRSHVSLLNRFKIRCEWYDADRLRNTIENTKRPEDKLRDEFARFLFDQGLSPITEFIIGRL